MTATTYWCEYALIGGEVITGAALTIVDGSFDSIDTAASAPPESTRLPGLTIAGLANSHSHAFHRALRSRTQRESGSFWTWRDLMYAAAERLDPDSYHRLARATFAEMALAGVAVVGEFHYLHHRPDGSPYDDPNAMGKAVLSAAEEAGIRITLLDTVYLHGGLGNNGYEPLGGPQRRFSDQTPLRWADRVDELSDSTTRRIGAAIHSVRAVDPAAIREVREWAAERDVPVHAHVSEQPLENEQCIAQHGLTPTGLLGESGVLSARFSAVHATHLSDADVGLLSAARSTVCLCPTTERDLGDGIGPTQRLAQAGVPMTLGSDSHAVIDMFEEARALELDERLAAQQRGIHTSLDLLTMATLNGHRSLGWADAGAIEVGMRADLVTVSLDSVRTAGSTGDTAVEAAVFAATAADVVNVVIDGKAVVGDGQHHTLDVAAELSASIDDLMAR